MRTVVVDAGSQSFRVGYAGEEMPRFTMRSSVGLPRATGSRATLLQHRTDMVAGDESYHDRGVLRLSYPVQEGHVKDFTGLERLLFHGLVNQAHVVPDNTPLLFLEPADQRSSDRERLCEMLFETLNIPLAGLLSNTAAVVYASGRTTGLAVDSGAGRTCIAAVHEGYTLPRTVRCSPVAGNRLTDELVSSLRTKGYPFSTDADWELADKLKRKLCLVSSDLAADLQHFKESDAPLPTDGYMLPDKERIFLLESAYTVPEALFNASYLSASAEVVGATTDSADALLQPSTPTGFSLSNPSFQKPLKGWVEMIHSAIAAAPLRASTELYRNVVLGGGTTTFRGLDYRLQRDLSASTPEEIEPTCVAFEERHFAPWIGGSIWGCTPVFAETCVSKAKYHEDGASIVHRYAQ